MSDGSAIIKFHIKDGKAVSSEYFIDYGAFQRNHDWYNLPEHEFYEKYPKHKPVYPLPRVTKDEVDKRIEYERSKGKGTIR